MHGLTWEVISRRMRSKLWANNLATTLHNLTSFRVANSYKVTGRCRVANSYKVTSRFRVAYSFKVTGKFRVIIFRVTNSFRNQKKT